jgi:hypothetical protein
VTVDQVITLRLEEIERVLASKSMHAVADQASRRIVVLPEGDRDLGDTQDLWHRVVTAPVIEMTDEELLSDDYLQVALRRVTLLFCTTRA